MALTILAPKSNVIDRDDHEWTWSSSLQGQLSSSGEQIKVKEKKKVAIYISLRCICRSPIMYDKPVYTQQRRCCVAPS